jgi:hypothetical protein
MTEKIKEIVNQFFDDCNNCWDTYKYKIDDSYYVKFQPLMQKNHIRVYLGVRLPAYEYETSGVYEIYYGPLNDADKGLAAFIEMQYRNAERMNKSNVSIGYDLYKSVLADNDKLREQIKTLEKDVETWKKASIENHGAYQSAMKNSEDWKNKYIQEKMDHTTTGARIVYAKHILSGNRDEKVIEHIGETHITNFE